MLRELEAQPDPDAIRELDVALDRVFHRIYAGIEVDKEGLERLREAAKDGTLVLLPSHKSHVDYLMLSFVFYAREPASCRSSRPATTSSFFPLGPILRRGGAFFIRRTFRGDRLYAPSSTPTCAGCSATAIRSSSSSKAGARAPASCFRPSSASSRWSSTPRWPCRNSEVFFVPI